MNCLWSEQMEIPALEPVIGDEQSDRLFTVHLQNRVDKDSPFEEQIYRLVEGGFPSASNEIVINQLLADRNGLQVGDDIQGNYRITGIFLSGTERQQTEKVATVNRIENQIYRWADENLPESCKGYTKVICYVTEPEQLDELAGTLDSHMKNRRWMQKLNRFAMSSVAAFALLVAGGIANHSCYWYFGQDEVPEGAKKLRRF